MRMQDTHAAQLPLVLVDKTQSFGTHWSIIVTLTHRSRTVHRGSKQRARTQRPHCREPDHCCTLMAAKNTRCQGSRRG